MKAGKYLLAALHLLADLLMLTSLCWYISLYEPDTLRLSRQAKLLAWSIANPPDSVLQTGNLVVRQGRGFISNAFRDFSLTDPRYSHAGLLHRQGNLVYVLHAIGGEENKDNRMRKESLASFLNPETVHAFGVYAYTMSAAERQNLDSLAMHYYHTGLQFDTHLNLESNEAMYCSELIYKIMPVATANRIRLSLTHSCGTSYVAVDNLYLHPLCHLLYEHTYTLTPASLPK